MLEFFYFFILDISKIIASIIMVVYHEWGGVEMSFKVLWFELYINDDKRL